ncbi:MAG: hypothetical protein IPG50_22035 [Myxococcales bacterium]|nr:hypothetical protein [Myxococcales bacterium]
MSTPRPFDARARTCRAVRTFAACGLVFAQVSLLSCTKRGREVEAGAALARAVADETRYAQEGRPRVFLADGARADCEPFRRYVATCPVVPTCEAVRKTHEALTHNACANERGALSRVMPCGTGAAPSESYCTTVAFPSCRALLGSRCDLQVALCEADDGRLATVRCAGGRYVPLPLRDAGAE